VLPRLEQDCARGGARWRTCVTTPGDEPITNLATALAGLGGQERFEARKLDIRRILNCGREGAAALADYVCGERQEHVCILIDQFEELFAHARRHGPQQASLLIELLIGLQNLSGPRPSILLTLRSEFLGACAQFEGFAQTVNITQYLLPRMEHADLMRAIREPAALYDGEIATDLAERLVADAGWSQDQLPLIQHGLMVLHRDCGPDAGKPWRLTLERYRGFSRLGLLLSEHADEVMRSAEPPGPPGTEGSRVVEDIFRALTDINADGQAIRRPQKLKDLVAVTGADESTVRKVVDAFRAEGVSFLRPYGSEAVALDDYVDISHEALIRCWGQIADKRDGWLIREFKNGLVWRSLLVQTESFERDSSNVLSPATTEERKAWLGRRNAAWSARYGGGWERVLKLMNASVAECERQMREDTEERSRTERAKLQEEQAKLREQELQANLAAALEKSRREKVFRWAFLVSVILLSATVFFAVSAYRARAIAVRETFNAELSARDLQNSLDDAEAKRRAAEESLESLKKLRVELAALGQAALVQTPPSHNGEAAPAYNIIQQGINLADSSIAKQEAVLSTAARLSPRIYIHIAEDSQRGAARELELRIEAGRIGDAPVIVPGIQLIDAPPTFSLLRCFVADDCKQYGPALLELINGQLVVPKVRLQDFSGVYSATKAIRPQHFELYFAAGSITLTGPPASAR
jgi:hypothetical protein